MVVVDRDDDSMDKMTLDWGDFNTNDNGFAVTPCPTSHLYARSSVGSNGENLIEKWVLDISEAIVVPILIAIRCAIVWTLNAPRRGAGAWAKIDDGPSEDEFGVVWHEDWVAY